MYRNEDTHATWKLCVVCCFLLALLHLCFIIVLTNPGGSVTHLFQGKSNSVKPITRFVMQQKVSVIITENNIYLTFNIGYIYIYNFKIKNTNRKSTYTLILKNYPLFEIIVDYEPLTNRINVSLRTQRVAWDLIMANTEGCQHLWLRFGFRHGNNKE